MPKKENKATKAEREGRKPSEAQGRQRKEREEGKKRGKGKGKKEQRETKARLDGRNNRFCYCARWAALPDTTI